MALPLFTSHKLPNNISSQSSLSQIFFMVSVIIPSNSFILVCLLFFSLNGFDILFTHSLIFSCEFGIGTLTSFKSFGLNLGYDDPLHKSFSKLSTKLYNIP